MLREILRQAEQPVEATLKARERRTASTQGSRERLSSTGADQSPALMRNTQITALRLWSSRNGILRDELSRVHSQDWTSLSSQPMSPCCG